MRPPAISYRDFTVASVAVGLDTVLFTSLMPAVTKGSTVFDASSTMVLLLNLAILPLLTLRRHAPVAVSLGLCAFAAALTLSVGSRPLLSLFIALYTAAALRPIQHCGWCLAATLGTHWLIALYDSSATLSSWASILGVAAVFSMLDLTVWFFGRSAAVTSRRARELVETREAMAAEAVASERLRIARELHDIVAHAVTVMVLQASGARRQLARNPALAEAALQSVEAVGKQAMGELRRLLEVLRSVADEDPGTGTPETLQNLETLVRQTEAAGVSVNLSMRGLAGQLDPSVELAAYRVVQEALTNVTRHAGPGAHADVVLFKNKESLAIDVDNDHGGSVPSVTTDLSSGYGLVGLRERVKLMGGELSVGPSDDGGYRVHAILPTAVAP